MAKKEYKYMYVRLEPHQKELVEEQSKKQGVSQADVIRNLIETIYGED